MEQDKHKTKVSFWIEPDPSEEQNIPEHARVLAYFPKSEEAGGLKICYSHIGQHSKCDPVYLKECKLATEDQYRDLKNELEGYHGYNLEILNQ